MPGDLRWAPRWAERPGRDPGPHPPRGSGDPPEGMGITWDDVFAAIKYEKEFLESNGYWYTVVNDFEVTEEFCQMIKEKVIAKYGEWDQ